MHPTQVKEKCTARSKQTGVRCGNWPTRGATVCRFHGGHIPAVRRKAEERLALAEALRRGDRRPVWEILLDAVHAADVLMRDVRASLDGTSGVTPDQLDRFVQAIERAARLAKTAIDARAIDRQVLDIQTEGRVIARLVLRAMAAANVDEATEDRLRTALAVEFRALTAGQMRDEETQRAVTGTF